MTENIQITELENGYAKIAIASILSLNPSEVKLQSDSINTIEKVFNDILDEFTDKWVRTLSFELKVDNLDKPCLINASAQFDNSLNPNNFSCLAESNYQKRLIILREFEKQLRAKDSLLTIQESTSNDKFENKIYKLTFKIEKLFNKKYHEYQNKKMDLIEAKNPDIKNIILDFNQIKDVSEEAYTASLSYIDKNVISDKEDSIWEKLIINSSINRTIIEFDELYRLSVEVRNLIHNILNDINFYLDFNLPEDDFIKEMFYNFKITENAAQNSIKNNAKDFINVYFNFQNKNIINPDFKKIHNSTGNKNLVHFIFSWLMYRRVTVNNRIIDDINPNIKIIVPSQEFLGDAQSTSVYYIIRRLYDTLYFSTELKEELFNKKDIFAYQDAIDYKRSKIRQIFVSIKHLNINTLNQLSMTLSD